MGASVHSGSNRPSVNTPDARGYWRSGVSRSAFGDGSVELTGGHVSEGFGLKPVPSPNPDLKPGASRTWASDHRRSRDHGPSADGAARFERCGISPTRQRGSIPPGNRFDGPTRPISTFPRICSRSLALGPRGPPQLASRSSNPPLLSPGSQRDWTEIGPSRLSEQLGFQPKRAGIADFCRIGETGFEPATARPPAGCATRLRHSPWLRRSYPRQAQAARERATGIEPALKAWKAFVQPQHFARGWA